MKKLALILTAALLLTLTSGALALEARPGEEVTFAFALNNTSAAMVRIKADYDRDVFELVRCAADGGQAGTYIVLYQTDGVSLVPSGPAGTVTLRVKADAKPGRYAVTPVLDQCYGWDEKAAVASVSGGGSVTVLAGDYPGGMQEPDFILPADETVIEEEAFYATNAVAVLLPEGMKEIGENAFAECPELRQIYIPAGASIAESAFDGVQDLTIFGHAGSPAEDYAKRHGYAFVACP